MPIGVLEIDPTSATPGVDLHILLRKRTTAVRNGGFLDSAEDGVELSVAYMESVVMHLKVIPIIEIERERFVDSNWREMTHGALVFEPEHVSEKLRRLLLVVRRHDRVIKRDAHDYLLLAARSDRAKAVNANPQPYYKSDFLTVGDFEDVAAGAGDERPTPDLIAVVRRTGCLPFSHGTPAAQRSFASFCDALRQQPLADPPEPQQ
jgi:hypothetical protein